MIRQKSDQRDQQQRTASEWKILVPIGGVDDIIFDILWNLPELLHIMLFIFCLTCDRNSRVNELATNKLFSLALYLTE